MSGLAVSQATREAQGRASDPRRSVFVAANAGSGKTFVLARRVVRLLVAGVPPARILCLTYTKAAAAEMQGRIFAILAQWTRASDQELNGYLSELGGQEPTIDDLARARRLFATALETPGGLKVQTIHAFCEQLLHLFPLEAHVPGHFEVMDEAESALLLAEARRRLIVSASGGTQDGLAEAFAEALSFGGEFGLDGLVAEIVAKRDAIGEHLSAAGGVEGAVAALAAALDLEADADEESLLAGAAEPPSFEAAFRHTLAALAARSGKATDAALVEKLQRFATVETNALRLEALRAICLKADGGRYKVGSIATKTVAEGFADFEARIAALADFVEAGAERLATLRLLRASRAALTIAEQLERDYQTLKRRRARLDFEDLIVRAADLLTRAEASAWVHYKLDQGIDHVLVDEAQDTSPRQWQVVRSLVEEFFEEPGERVRTLFAVGDEKQSIYSFQGASPAMFAQERAAIEAHARERSAAFERVALHQSFRSAPDILAAVDLAFEAETDRRGLSAEGERPVHSSARGPVPGLVEIWPPVVKEKAPETDDWLIPIDEEPRSSPLVRLATRIAETIEGWLGTAIEHRGTVRPMTPGDVVVLVRKRSAFVGAMSAALRERGIRVAGADRLVITDHIAVQDLIALGRTIANPQDELSLAAVLKSPLLGFTDDELMALALTRRAQGPEPLYAALRRAAEEIGAVPGLNPALRQRAGTAFARLEELRRRAGFEGVFAFYARLLGPEGGRRLLTARLGRDSGEVIDAFLDLALTFETSGGADLDGFLSLLETSPPTIKREMGQARGEVRIMTVHAAKGLEAPVVFLVDPGSAPFVHAHGARLIEWTGMPGLPPEAPSGFLWCPETSLVNADVTRLRDAERGRAEDEYRRLLYVGMTRAADRLVICGHAGANGPSEDSWIRRVEASVGARCERVLGADGTLTTLRWGRPPEASRDGAGRPAVAPAPVAPRPIDLSPLPPETAAPKPLVPSDPAGTLRIDKAEEAGAGSPVLAAAAPSLAIRRGLLVHRLLQVLPELAAHEREAAGARYLARAAPEIDARDREAMLASVLRILSDPRYGEIFGPEARAEVGVRGSVRLGERSYPVSGTVDRLAAGPQGVLIVDYKTNRPPPAALAEIPPAYVLQLALYRALLLPLYPGTAVRSALLFTEGPFLVELPAEAMEAALAELAARRSPADA